MADHVQHRAANDAGLHRFDQVGLVHQGPPGHVDEHGGGLHLTHQVQVNKAGGLGHQTHVDGDEVRPGQALVQVHLLRAEFPGGLVGDKGVIGQNGHAQGVGPLGGDLADVAKAHEQQSLPAQAVDGLAEGGDAPDAVFQLAIQGLDGLVEVEHGGQDIVGDVLGAIAVHVGHGDSGGLGGLHVHVVIAAAKDGDALAALQFGDHVGGDVGGHLGKDHVGLGAEVLQVLLEGDAGIADVAVGIGGLQGGLLHGVVGPLVVDDPKQGLFHEKFLLMVDWAVLDAQEIFRPIQVIFQNFGELVQVPAAQDL